MPRYVPIHKQLNFTYDLGHWERAYEERDSLQTR
jgi:hypothetical protein